MVFVVHRSQQERKTLLSQRSGNPELYYNSKSFLEPISATHLHRSEIPSIQKASDEVKIVASHPTQISASSKSHPTLTALLTGPALLHRTPQALFLLQGISAMLPLILLFQETLSQLPWRVVLSKATYLLV